MHDTTVIRILEIDNNKRGDLFGKLMADLFVALGYEQPKLNVHKSGRELDISTHHRLEPRSAIAECKATSEKIGGDDLNKFVGVLDIERRQLPRTVGYFISLSGFKETAMEQEKGRRHKVIMLNGSQVVTELVNGRLLISRERAAELAGRCCGLADVTLDTEAELLAHRRGWIWAIYYTVGKLRKQVALIHSDGTPLARELADEVIAADHICGGKLRELACLNPVTQPETDTDEAIENALNAYRQYLANECGFIQMDGLPTDTETLRVLKLEDLFVPLHLKVIANDELPQSVGSILAKESRLAILAPPGSGKSTLIKRLAVAYADHARREQITDGLPEKNWLPLFFRCRELRQLAREPFTELIEALSNQEILRRHSRTFRRLVDRALLEGTALLLVDGLDEISHSGDRAAFVSTLRAALRAYPETPIVVTSRESGFRHVAAHLATVCTNAALAPFEPADIRRLTASWHREVLGDTDKIRADAQKLAEIIIQNDRIKRLAVNPLLLTTLLLVKRWVGSLPTGRAALYGKAVELLLMTWNTEGHDAIPPEEALPQLCYVASAMMLSGVQKISRPKLTELLKAARNALPTELGYVGGTVENFIMRVEDRSSLLMMTGSEVEDGELAEFFEFRHLTFQEFLTARAVVEGWYPNRNSKDTLFSVLEPHLKKQEWYEVFPLAAVLGRKATEVLIRGLTQEAHKIGDALRAAPNVNHALICLINCLADEAKASPDNIRAALREMVRLGSLLDTVPSIQTLIIGRYGEDFRDEAGKALLSDMADLGNFGNALRLAVRYQMLNEESDGSCCLGAKSFTQMLNHPEAIRRCEGAIGVGWLCSFIGRDKLTEFKTCASCVRESGLGLLNMLFNGSTPEYWAACYALAPLCGYLGWSPPTDLDILERLFTLWQESTDRSLRRYAALALAAQPLMAHKSGGQWISIPVQEIQALFHNYAALNFEEKSAVLVLSWYTKVGNRLEIEQLAKHLLPEVSSSPARDSIRFLTARRFKASS